jgi:hypothetical protein
MTIDSLTTINNGKHYQIGYENVFKIQASRYWTAETKTPPHFVVIFRDGTCMYVPFDNCIVYGQNTIYEKI